MGEVYRARDTRLGRDVALKVLPDTLTLDPDRLRRLEQEARAASQLSHPSILVVHDVGQHDGTAYLVSELLEGETLRTRIAGAGLAPRRALDYARQIAHGLAAAHEKGIVHRDLKPDNVFVTDDGRVKILDFGLAKLTQAEGKSLDTDSPTRTAGTDAGTVMGTAGYMSPEQVRGKPTDHSTDIFAFGAVLYEMLSGRRAFRGETSADTMTAILREDPPELSAVKAGIPPGLERIVRHCLEKNAAERFQSARDLAFDLEALSTSLESGPAAVRTATRLPRLVPILATLVALAAAFLVGRRSVAPSPDHASHPVFKRETFGRGNVLGARFTADGRSIVYGAAWLGHPPEIFLKPADAPESRSLGLPPGDVLAVSPQGELAIVLNKIRPLEAGGGIGMLARVPIGGGAPREMMDGVTAADWTPDGQALAVVRLSTSGKVRLEFPLGTPLFETAYGLMSPRVSPDGERVAIVAGESEPYHISVFNKAGHKTELGTVLTVNGSFLAWSAAGDEVWTAGETEGQNGALLAFDMAGRERTVLTVPGALTLQDIARDGRVLLEQDVWQYGLVASRGDGERDLTWLGGVQSVDLSADGAGVLFSELLSGQVR